MRETAAQRAARIDGDNKAAAALPTGLVAQGFFGEQVLLGKDGTDEDGWDLYQVRHSGFIHIWSSAVVARSFRQKS